MVLSKVILGLFVKTGIIAKNSISKMNFCDFLVKIGELGSS